LRAGGDIAGTSLDATGEVVAFFLFGVDCSGIAEKDSVGSIKAVDGADRRRLGNHEPRMPDILLEEVAQQSGALLHVNDLSVDARVFLLGRKKGHDSHDEYAQECGNDCDFYKAEAVVCLGLIRIHQRFSRLKRKVDAATDRVRPPGSVHVTRISMERVSFGTTSWISHEAE